MRSVVAMADTFSATWARGTLSRRISRATSPTRRWAARTRSTASSFPRSPCSRSRAWPLEQDPAPFSVDDARRLLHKVVGWGLLLDENEEKPARLRCTWKVREEACGQKLVARINAVLNGADHPPAEVVFEAPNQVRAELSTPSAGGLTVN
jgi:4a-hydroxytetrahydrobiopterin dehydratase